MYMTRIYGGIDMSKLPDANTYPLNQIKIPIDPPMVAVNKELQHPLGYEHLNDLLELTYYRHVFFYNGGKEKHYFWSDKPVNDGEFVCSCCEPNMNP